MLVDQIRTTTIKESTRFCKNANVWTLPANAYTPWSRMRRRSELPYIRNRPADYFQLIGMMIDYQFLGSTVPQ